ncbi:MAG: hypothetical protein ACOX06_02375 [Candidatus Dojkabacteria bacterium]|jgi:uridylate kinase
MDKKDIVLKVGGSLLYSENQDINFDIMGKIKSWYVENKDIYWKFVMVTGGGTLSRSLQSKVGNNIANEQALHSIAMSVTQTSAELLGGFLGHSNIFIPSTLGEAYEYLLEDTPGTLVSGGLKLGWSTDMDAAVFADILFEKRIYKLSNIEYVYDKDPKKYSDATPIKDMTWKEYFDLFSITDTDEHQANHSLPIDKVSARFCRNKEMSFFICGGKNLMEKEGLGDILSEGTLIHP